MDIERIIFWVFAVILVFAAGRVITVRNPVHAAMHLVLAFFTCAGLWLLLEAEFLAITLVLVYVGAVMVLFLFVVMMLDINMSPLREGFVRYLPFGVIIALVVFSEMFAVVGVKYFGSDVIAIPERHGADYSNVRELGNVLYTDYVYPFEIASVILLVAIIAAIALTMRKRPGTKSQNVAQQVAVKSADRVRVVKMMSEEKQGSSVRD
ncbi:MAG TPA: NADH-quinone oxidoreductase subunit J [Gammaproteobacteria bacterium]|jgi:NADH-quinone oxidoreductase subunit J|nr:NADH-quinone oxidoreductase subunit J [Gammaproteobacteria bacterium]